MYVGRILSAADRRKAAAAVGDKVDVISVVADIIKVLYLKPMLLISFL